MCIKEKDLSNQVITCNNCFKDSLRKHYIKININGLNGVKCPRCGGTF